MAGVGGKWRQLYLNNNKKKVNKNLKQIKKIKYSKLRTHTKINILLFVHKKMSMAIMTLHILYLHTENTHTYIHTYM